MVRNGSVGKSGSRCAVDRKFSMQKTKRKKKMLKKRIENKRSIQRERRQRVNDWQKRNDRSKRKKLPTSYRSIEREWQEMQNSRNRSERESQKKIFILIECLLLLLMCIEKRMESIINYYFFLLCWKTNSYPHNLFQIKYRTKAPWSYVRSLNTTRKNQECFPLEYSPYAVYFKTFFNNRSIYYYTIY